MNFPDEPEIRDEAPFLTVMPNVYPDTPVSLLSRLEKGKSGPSYQTAWNEFFDLYHNAIRISALGTFRRFHWVDVPPELLDEIVADVVVSFFKADFRYDPDRGGRFRNYLRQLTTWRIMDKFGKLPAHATERVEGAGEEQHAELLDLNQPDSAMDERERTAFRSALLATMLEDVRAQIDPQTFFFFEQAKLCGERPEALAAQYEVRRNVVDLAVHRVMRRLQALAGQPEYRKEYLS